LKANGVSAVAIKAALTDDENNLPEWLSKAELPSKEVLKAGDSLRKGRKIPPPKVIKMDIEGAEKFALEGLSETLSNETLRVLFVEIHPQGCFSEYPDRFEDVGLTTDEIEALEDQLDRAGFSVTTIHTRDEQKFLKAHG